MLKRLFAIILLAVLALVAVVLVRTLRAKPEQVSVPAPNLVTVDPGAVNRFAAAVRVPTISNFGQPVDQAAMAQLRTLLETSFPRVHAAMTREVLPSGSLIFTWKGKYPSADPVILMGHMDVVPVEQSTLDHWKHQPFSGDIAEGSIWGRGTLDDKAAVLSTLEAAETLLAQGYTPPHTILLCFGSDEENGGITGASSLVKVLASRGVHARLVVDEGGGVASGMLPGLAQPLAVIGISEKGYLSLKLSTTGAGGHSSEPPPHTAIGELAAGITRLEAHPFPGSLPAPTRIQFEALAPYLPFTRKLALANLWLTRPIVVSAGLKDPKMAGGYHTTTAVDMIAGGTKDNVLPTTASAVVNFRILPGETVDSTIAGVRHRLADPAIQVDIASPLSAHNPSPVSPTDTPGFRSLATTIHQIFPSAIISPYLVQAATDSAYYYAVSPNVYRFAPLNLNVSAMTMVHGFNEHITTANYIQMVQFEAQFIQNLQ
jgi:carboxypeptidase PM20D1